MSRRINRQAGFGFLAAAVMTAGCSGGEVAPMSVSQAIQFFRNTERSAQRYTIEGPMCILEEDSRGRVTFKVLGNNGEGLRLQRLENATFLARQVNANCLLAEESKAKFRIEVKKHKDNDGDVYLADGAGAVVLVEEP